MQVAKALVERVLASPTQKTQLVEAKEVKNHFLNMFLDHVREIAVLTTLFPCPLEAPEVLHFTARFLPYKM